HISVQESSMITTGPSTTL
nr:immunoglobulin heavy chain junction region [Mus musculus]